MVFFLQLGNCQLTHLTYIFAQNFFYIVAKIFLWKEPIKFITYFSVDSEFDKLV